MTAGDIVVVDFPGVTGVKRRPAVIVSSDSYHAHRPDVIICLLTTQIGAATAPTDYALQDWAAAGLHRPTAMRCFVATLPAASVVTRGRLSGRDWQEVQVRLGIAFSLP